MATGGVLLKFQSFVSARIQKEVPGYRIKNLASKLQDFPRGRTVCFFKPKQNPDKVIQVDDLEGTDLSILNNLKLSLSVLIVLEYSLNLSSMTLCNYLRNKFKPYFLPLTSHYEILLLDSSSLATACNSEIRVQTASREKMDRMHYT